MDESIQVISSQVGEILNLCRALTGVLCGAIVAIVGAGLIFFGAWFYKNSRE